MHAHSEGHARLLHWRSHERFIHKLFKGPFLSWWAFKTFQTGVVGRGERRGKKTQFGCSRRQWRFMIYAFQSLSTPSRRRVTLSAENKMSLVWIVCANHSLFTKAYFSPPSHTKNSTQKKYEERGEEEGWGEKSLQNPKSL